MAIFVQSSQPDQDSSIDTFAESPHALRSPPDMTSNYRGEGKNKLEPKGGGEGAPRPTLNLKPESLTLQLLL